MKLIKSAVMLNVCLTVILVSVKASALTGEEIIKKASAVINQATSESISEMTIITSSKQERTFVSRSYSKNMGEKNLVRYTKPKRIKDQAFLMLNHSDDIWAYFPRTTRVRKLATHAKRQKMEGSDFTYEDMGSGDSFVRDYAHKFIGEEKREGYDCYKVELVRKPKSDAGYSRIIMWVIKGNFFPVVSDFYNTKDPELLEKELIAYDIEEVQGVPTAMKMTMFNKKDRTSTTIETLSVKYNMDLPDNLFSERNLRV